MIKFENNENEIKVYTPYNKDYAADIKQITGAKWYADDRCWLVPAEAEATARGIVAKHYSKAEIYGAEKGEKVVLVNFKDNENNIIGKQVLKSFPLFITDDGKFRSDDYFKNNDHFVFEDGKLKRTRHIGLIDDRIYNGEIMIDDEGTEYKAYNASNGKWDENWMLEISK